MDQAVLFTCHHMELPRAIFPGLLYTNVTMADNTTNEQKFILEVSKYDLYNKLGPLRI